MRGVTQSPHEPASPMQAPQNNRPSARHLGRKLALSCGALLVAVLLVEAAARVRQFAKQGTFGQVHEFVHDPRSGLEIPPPGRRTARLSINSLGFRGPELERPKPAGRLRLAFLGGSTTFCAEASGDAATWPALVAQSLAAQLDGRAVDYVNAGVGGYRLEQLQVNLERRVAELEPDVIVIYEATNDLTKDTRELALAQGVYTGHADDLSWLAEHSLAWYLVEKNLLLRRRQSAALSAGGRVHFEPRELSRAFRARLANLCDAARRRARLVVLLTFSTHARRAQDATTLLEACNTSLYYMPYMTPELLLEGFDEYNRVIREVAAEQGVLLLDVASAVPGDSAHFNDSVHLKDAGCAALAEAVVAGLLAAPGFRELAAR